MKFNAFFLTLILAFPCMDAILRADELVEVDKGKVPRKFLDISVKSLPNGVAIWDEKRAVDKMKESDKKVLWVDTRPVNGHMRGSIRGAVNLVYDRNGRPAGRGKGNILTKQSLDTLRRGKSLIVFFCNGFNCHRSYNAAIRAVQVWKIPASQVVWLRGGYPRIQRFIIADPELRKNIVKYLQGISIH